MIFQDPISSLNPRRRIGKVVSEPLDVWGPSSKEEKRELTDKFLEAVGIDPDVARPTSARMSSPAANVSVSPSRER